MKIIITESRYKNILFRYWDKFGGDIKRLKSNSSSDLSEKRQVFELPKTKLSVTPNFRKGFTFFTSTIRKPGQIICCAVK